ncbi:putative calcium-transporting ATPase 4, plasma membrane-type, partial [Tetrabaena socialis]
VKVSRNGKQVVVINTEIVVGDVMFLDTGDKIIADGLVIDAQGLVIDEASLTGESDPIKKDATNDPWVRSGTTVNEGSGHMLVVAVGINSEWGKTLALVAEAGDDKTPLQEQLTDVATKVSKMGVLVAVVCFLALLIKWLIVHKGGDVKKINDNGPLQARRARGGVIERDNRILGAALLLDLGQTPDGVTVAEVGAFCVDPIYRGSGRGDSLLDYVEQDARGGGIQRLVLLTTRTADWFEQRDFRWQGAAYASELLPIGRRSRINPARNSQLYVKNLEAPADDLAPGKRIGF